MVAISAFEISCAFEREGTAERRRKAIIGAFSLRNKRSFSLPQNTVFRQKK